MRPDAPVAVLGGGAWGTALALAAAAAAPGRTVTLWLRDAVRAAAIRESRESPALPGLALPPAIRVTADPTDLAEAGAALAVVPAQTMRDVVARLGPALSAAAPVVICAKGIERERDRFLSDAVRSVRPRAPVAVLSGPSFAADVARGLPTAVTLAAEEAGLAEALAFALSGPTFRVYHGTDVRGVEIGGAAKNVLAIAAGIVEGRGLGESAKAALVARGFAELTRFALAYGARPGTLTGLSGLGDLILTCASEASRNFAYGVRIGRGVPPGEAAGGKLAEGAFTADALVRLARAAGIEMPIAEAVSAVIAGRLSVAAAAEALLRRPLRAE
ncbi:MAG: NAD(P)-dependent glycerol-3-phosphate dehydrogenase [Methylobacteriaceae bacterium]|nr:NAD(P)-dependent glycerol-3-phosphate dehydrogenase [Methylobacteriaceae bacterium]